MDACNCCIKCFRVHGQTCGGVGYIVGRCGKGLKCNLAYATFKNPVGYCVPLLMPTAAPVQLGHLTKVPFLGVGSQEAKNFDQQSAVTRKNIPGVPRQNIPGVPSRKTEENTIKKEQTSSEYFVHASDLWSMDSVKILNDTAQSHPDMLAKNLTQNSTHTDDQRRQKLADKVSVENIIPDMSPAVIFVAVSGAVFLCLVIIGLLFLPLLRKNLKSPK